MQTLSAQVHNFGAGALSADAVSIATN